MSKYECQYQHGLMDKPITAALNETQFTQAIKHTNIRHLDLLFICNNHIVLHILFDSGCRVHD